MIKLKSKKNYFNIIKHIFLPKDRALLRSKYYFMFLNKKIYFDSEHLANRNLIQWCLNKNHFHKKSNCTTEIFYEQKEMLIFEKLIVDSNYFIDLGAQTGIYSLAAYSSKKIKKIICVDIINEYMTAIKKNIKINGFKVNKFQILNLGIGSNKIFHKEWIAQTETNGCSFEEILNIAGLRLSEHDCVKIDIEGWEFFLAKEIGKYFKTTKPNLLLSLHKKEIERLSNKNVSENNIFDFLSLHYQFKYITDDKTIFKEIKSLKDNNLNNQKNKTIFFSNKKF